MGGTNTTEVSPKQLVSCYICIKLVLWFLIWGRQNAHTEFEASKVGVCILPFLYQVNSKHDFYAKVVHIAW